MNCSETLRYINELLSNEGDREEPNDGFVTIREAELEKHVINLDADHFELIGLRQGYNSASLFELYSNIIKNSNDEIIRSMVNF
jgi:hypothetical protein